ncbi:related to aliphatic nitrilase [Rhynchosporium agropyri]|uniref:Related to aliphatic nitrilase n=1 Tax=Rhynchosporium agropyri TaxID=914238 RepID=A0A1E1JTZ6_9HELO|nr:related to aliphatic nitrilase [Rhynchosporium agropyri]
MARPIRVAACHVSAVFLSAKGTTEKAISLIHQAAKNRANLVVFPETFIPAFPIWSSIRPPTENHGLFQKMAQQSIYIDGPEMSAIQAAAKKSTTIVSIGILEKVRYSAACLFNSNVIVGSDGEIMVHHRKLMPTFFEKLTWSPGDGYGLRVAETPFGKIGNLICGENTNPLARYSLMALGEELHISTWPAIWPTRAPLPVEMEGFKEVEPTSASSNDEVGKKGPVNYDNVAANRMRAAAHCFEAKCFGVLCSGRFDEMAIDLISEGSSNAQHIRRTLEQSPAAATMFLDPTGALLPGYTIDTQSGKKLTKDFLQKEEDILYADMDLNDCIEGKQYHDVVGGYQRLDVFDLKVNRSRRVPASFVDDFTPN